MHIVLVSNYSPPYQGGIQFIMSELGKQYALQNHTVTIIACDTGINTGTSRQGNITYIGVPAINLLERYSIPYPIFNPIELFRVLRQVVKSANIIHVHGLLYMSCVMAAWMGKMRGVRVIATEHVAIVSDGRPLVDLLQIIMFNTLGRLCCRFCDAVVVYNERVFEEVKRLTTPKTPIVEIRNGVDTSRFSAASSAERALLREKWDFNKPVVLFAGRLVRKKGLDLLLDTASASDEFELVICGKGELSVSSPNVRFIGLVDQLTLAELYRAADIFALVSYGEGFPLVVQEAMASGLPVIVTNEPVNRTYLDESVAIFVDRSVDKVLAQILELINDEPRRLKMGTAAQAWARIHFDWDRTRDAYLRLYASNP